MTPEMKEKYLELAKERLNFVRLEVRKMLDQIESRLVKTKGESNSLSRDSQMVEVTLTAYNQNGLRS